MTDLPDAETAWREWFPVDEKSPRPGEREAFLAGLDAANAEREALKQEVADRVGDLVTLQRQLDAALARNAELEREVGQWKDRMWVSVRERAVWSHEAGEHAGDIPFLNCPICESSTARAELDNLRETLVQKIETDDGFKEHPWMVGMKRAVLIVRGSDDEAKP